MSSDTIVIFSFVLFLCTCCIAFAYQISYDTSDNSDSIEYLLRHKRQLEDLDTDDFSAAGENSQDQPSFWDRMVKVALRLFNKFIEWLNT